MVHVALGFFNSQTVEDLLVADGAQGGDGKYLGLAAGEQAGAVGPRQQADFAGHGTDFIDFPAVGTDFIDSNHLADDFFQYFLKD